ncbi:MAG: PilZ domain-containing protein [Nitrospirae bacterium]|nr:PilZ domain-containing protein [Nitrospirota bacterium]
MREKYGQDQNPDIPNLRRHKRFSVDVMEISGRMILVNSVEIIDISIGGVSLKADKRLNIGGEYTLKMMNKSKIISVRGSVVWSSITETKKGPKGDIAPIYTAGLKFSSLSKEDLHELIDFIEERAHVTSAEFEVHRLSGLRFNIRFPVDTPGRAVLNFDESYRVKKLSLGGMLIESSHEIDIEKRLPMEISLDDKRHITFLGRIASCIPIHFKERQLHDVGIEFLEMSEADREALRDFIGLLPSAETGS